MARVAHDGRGHPPRVRPSTLAGGAGRRLRSGGLAGPTGAESPRAYFHPERRQRQDAPVCRRCSVVGSNSGPRGEQEVT